MAKLHDRLLQLSSDGVCRFTLQSGRILLANAGLARLLEIAEGPARLHGATLDRVMPPADGPVLRERMVEGKEPQTLEYRFLSAAGHTHGVTVYATVVHDRQVGEKVVEAIFLSVVPGNAVDDRERQAREVWLQGLVEHAAGAFSVHDAEGRLLDVSRCLCELLDYGREELLARNLCDLVPGFSGESVTTLWQQAQAQGVATIETYLQRRDGTRLPVEIRASAVELGGRVLMLCLMADTTARRCNEEEVRRLKAELERRNSERAEQLETTSQELQQELMARQRAEESWREQSGFLRVLLETVPVPIFFKGADGRYLGCNRAFVQFLGVPRERIVGKSVQDLASAALADVYEKADRELFKNGGSQRYECQVAMADGAMRDVVFHKAIFSKNDGTAGGLVGAILDVTERHRAEREIRALNETLRERAVELEAANRELQTFSYSVSHDLRAPLRAIAGFAAAMEEDLGASLPAPSGAHVQRIRAAARRMDELIDDLLKLSRVMRAEVHREPVDLTTLAGAVVENLRHASPERLVEVALAPGMVCEGDVRLLQIVLENLLNNAWKFTAGKSPARIEMGQEWIDGLPAFFVRDNGTGFDMAYVRKLFVPFQRLHSVDEFPGNGVGLATVQRIIGRHGGRAWAEGRPGEGATFFFSLGEARSGE